MVLALFVRLVTLELPVMSQTVPFDRLRFDVPLEVMAVPFSFEPMALMVSGLPEAANHRPSLPAVTMVFVNVMTSLLPARLITGPAALVSMLPVKVAVLLLAITLSALAAPVVVIVTPVAVMLLFGFGPLSHPSPPGRKS
jgi:hypothetical protein